MQGESFIGLIIRKRRWKARQLAGNFTGAMPTHRAPTGAQPRKSSPFKFFRHPAGEQHYLDVDRGLQDTKYQSARGKALCSRLIDQPGPKMLEHWPQMVIDAGVSTTILDMAPSFPRSASICCRAILSR